MYNTEESKYLDLIKEIEEIGDTKYDRTGVGTKAVFGRQLKYNLFNRRLPIVTTRKIKPLDPLIEMLWFISGDTNIAFLKKYKINIWDSWVIKGTEEYDSEGKLIAGSIGSGAYGAQWRNWEDTRIATTVAWQNKYKNCGYQYITALNETNISGGTKMCVITRRIDQLQTAIDMIKKSPDSRRIIVSAWNPGRFEDQALPACHSLFQFYTYDLSLNEKKLMLNYMVEEGTFVLSEERAEALRETYVLGKEDEIIAKLGLPTKGLKLHLYCRSQDYLVGTVYNTLQYAGLAHMVAQVTNTWASQLTWSASDIHVYSNQWDGACEQLQRMPIECTPTLHLNPAVTDIDDFTPEDFTVEDYEYQAFIKYPIAV